MSWLLFDGVQHSIRYHADCFPCCQRHTILIKFLSMNFAINSLVSRATAKLTNKALKHYLYSMFPQAFETHLSTLSSFFISGSSMSTLFLRTLGLVLLLSAVNAKPTGLQDRATSIDASSINGKFLFGYQGFFRRPGQGNDHWSINYGEIPGPSNPGAGEFHFYFG